MLLQLIANNVSKLRKVKKTWESGLFETFLYSTHLFCWLELTAVI